MAKGTPRETPRSRIVTFIKPGSAYLWGHRGKVAMGVLMILAALTLWFTMPSRPRLELNYLAIVPMTAVGNEDPSRCMYVCDGKRLFNPVRMSALLTNTGSASLKVDKPEKSPLIDFTSSGVTLHKVSANSAPQLGLDVKPYIKDNKIYIPLDVFKAGESVDIEILCDGYPYVTPPLIVRVGDEPNPITNNSRCGPKSFFVAYMYLPKILEYIVIVIAGMGCVYLVIDFIKRFLHLARKNSIEVTTTDIGKVVALGAMVICVSLVFAGDLRYYVITSLDEMRQSNTVMSGAQNSMTAHPAIEFVAPAAESGIPAPEAVPAPPSEMK